MLQTQLAQISNILSAAKVNTQWMNQPSEMGLHMASLIEKYAKDPIVILTGRDIVRQCKGDEECESKNIYEWVKNNVNYVQDPADYEQIITPDIAISSIKLYGYFNEDCDSITVLLGSLLKAVGIPVKIVMIRTSGNNNYNHVYLRALIMNGNNKAEYVNLDATYKQNVYGWEHPGNNKIEIGRLKQAGVI